MRHTDGTATKYGGRAVGGSELLRPADVRRPARGREGDGASECGGSMRQTGGGLTWEDGAALGALHLASGRLQEAGVS